MWGGRDLDDYTWLSGNLRLGDFLVSCVAQLTSRVAGTISLVFSSDQVLCARIVRFILTGHDGVLLG
jgi:hypothetical protein